MSRILFLCTGNYYRSRFAEEYFNHVAVHHGVPWRADSKALVRDLGSIGNRGPISPHALAQLAALGVPSRGEPRWPARVEAADFLRYPRVVALSRREHEPMLRAHFPEHALAVEYMEIGDIDVETPQAAIARLARELDTLVAELRSPSGA
jgi:protein-tyrosine phosphatase